MKMTLNHGSGHIDFEVIYSDRRTIAIIISPEGDVKVRVPYRTSPQVIMDLVDRKAEWIIRKLQQMELIKTRADKRDFLDGEPFPYLGRDHPLYIRIDARLSRAKAILEDGLFIIDTPAADTILLKNAMEAWYRDAALKYIRSRIDDYAPILNASPKRITIRQQKTRWGSCSSKGNLSFNWRIVMAPAKIMDYVIVHELCHLIRPDHSREFWSLVGSIIPDYKERRTWLKNNAAKLTWQP
ncbi:MAG TPA: SprT family zinc-dependent metalloprotease [Syntrophomonadaceae bacterium]|nr:SprT family zinc-dependent metalloprotease [Syntrophomonadaceae bacterium]